MTHATARNALVAPALLLVLLALACGPSKPPVATGPGAAAVAISEATGEATRRTEAKSDWAPAAKGDRLTQSGSVKTGADGSVWLELPGGGVSHLQSNAELSVSELVGAESAEAGGSPARLLLELLQGAGLFRWEPSGGELTIKTPHVQAAVLGTEFALEVTAEGTTLIVARGKVRLEKGTREQVVEAGRQCVAPATGELQTPVPAQLIGGTGLAGQLERFVEQGKGLRQRRGIERR